MGRYSRKGKEVSQEPLARQLDRKLRPNVVETGGRRSESMKFPNLLAAFDFRGPIPVDSIPRLKVR